MAYGSAIRSQNLGLSVPSAPKEASNPLLLLCNVLVCNKPSISCSWLQQAWHASHFTGKHTQGVACCTQVAAPQAVKSHAVATGGAKDDAPRVSSGNQTPTSSPAAPATPRQDDQQPSSDLAGESTSAAMNSSSPVPGMEASSTGALLDETKLVANVCCGLI